jgi:hypothetical protein
MMTFCRDLYEHKNNGKQGYITDLALPQEVLCERTTKSTATACHKRRVPLIAILKRGTFK